MKFVAPDHRGNRVERAGGQAVHKAGITIKKHELPAGPYDWFDVLQIFVVIACSAAGAALASNRLTASGIGLALAALAIWLIRPLVRRGRDRAWLPAFESALLRRDVCPSCLGTLDKAIAALDGCMTCPWCNAAWRPPNNDEQQQGASHA
ncbi:MAG: hypothetical protein AAFR96_07385 [Planctomycetota bacterium]